MMYCLGIALVSSAALAQPPYGGQGQNPRGDPNMRIERMKKHLDLSEEQVKQMEAIRDSDATQWEKRDQMRAVLTDEQRAIIEENRARRQGMQRGGGPPPAAVDDGS
jgi:Spy/CpxP family protein refolding chaperone